MSEEDRTSFWRRSERCADAEFGTIAAWADYARATSAEGEKEKVAKAKKNRSRGRERGASIGGKNRGEGVALGGT